MVEEKRLTGEQRTDDDRRALHDLEYFMNSDTERRDFRERRTDPERRSGWVRVGKWVSVFARALGYRQQAG
jgi:hypothetical protein